SAISLRRNDPTFRRSDVPRNAAAWHRTTMAPYNPHNHGPSKTPHFLKSLPAIAAQKSVSIPASSAARASKSPNCRMLYCLSSGRHVVPMVTEIQSSVGEWLSLVEHLVRDQGVGGSNPLSPTNLSLALSVVYAAFCSSVFSPIFGTFGTTESNSKPLPLPPWTAKTPDGTRVDVAGSAAQKSPPTLSNVKHCQ